MPPMVNKMVSLVAVHQHMRVIEIESKERARVRVRRTWAQKFQRDREGDIYACRSHVTMVLNIG